MVWIVWDNVYGFDYSCIKDIALREPLVDTVELKAVVTDPCLIKVSPITSILISLSLNFGLSTLTSWRRKKMISFSNHPSHWPRHAMTTFTPFSRGSIFHLNAPTKRSSSPQGHTHNIPTGSMSPLFVVLPISHVNCGMFRQTVFYTPSTITIGQGETITGSLSCAPNAKNNRDLDIVIQYQLGQEKPVDIHYKMCVVLSLRTPFIIPSVWTNADRLSGLDWLIFFLACRILFYRCISCNLHIPASNSCAYRYWRINMGKSCRMCYELQMFLHKVLSVLLSEAVLHVGVIILD